MNILKITYALIYSSGAGHGLYSLMTWDSNVSGAILLPNPTSIYPVNTYWLTSMNEGLF